MNAGDRDWGLSTPWEDYSEDLVLKLEDGFRYDPKVEKEVAEEWRKKAGKDILGLSSLLSRSMQTSSKMSDYSQKKEHQKEFSNLKSLAVPSKYDGSSSTERYDFASSKKNKFVQNSHDVSAKRESRMETLDENGERSRKTTSHFENMKRKLNHRIQLQFLQKPKYIVEDLKQKARQIFLKIINCDEEELKAFNEWRSQKGESKLEDRIDWRKEEEKKFVYQYVELLLMVPGNFLFELDFAVKPIEKPAGQIIEDMKEKTRQIFSKITGHNEKEETNFKEFVEWKKKEDDKEFFQQYMELLTMIPSNIPTYLLKTDIERRWDYNKAVNVDWENFNYGKTKEEMQKSVYRMRIKFLGESHLVQGKPTHFPVYGTDMYGKRTLWPPDQEDPGQPEFSYDSFLSKIENEALMKENCKPLNPCDFSIPYLHPKTSTVDEIEMSPCLQNLYENLQLEKPLKDEISDTCSIDSFKIEGLTEWQYDIRDCDANVITYLENCFATLFREACNALYEARPADPIQYFVTYLLKNHPSGKLSLKYLQELEKKYFPSEDLPVDDDKIKTSLSDNCIQTNTEDENTFESNQIALERKIIADQKRIAKEAGYTHLKRPSLLVEDIIQDCIKVLNDVIDVCVEVVPLQVKVQKERKENQATKLLEILQRSDTFENELIENLAGELAIKRLLRNILFAVTFVETDSSGVIVTKIISDFECKSRCVMNVLKTVISCRQMAEKTEDDPDYSHSSQVTKPFREMGTDQQEQSCLPCIENVPKTKLKTRNELAYYMLKKIKWKDLPSEKLDLHLDGEFINQDESGRPREEDTYNAWDISRLTKTLWEEDDLPDDLWNEYVQESIVDVDLIGLRNGILDKNNTLSLEEGTDSIKKRGSTMQADENDRVDKKKFAGKYEIDELKSGNEMSDDDNDFEESDEKIEVKGIIDSHDVEKDVKFVIRNVLFTIAYVFDMKVKTRPSLDKSALSDASNGKHGKVLKKHSDTFEKLSKSREMSRILSLVSDTEKDSYKSLVNSYIRAFETVIDMNTVDDILRNIRYLKKNEFSFSEERRNEINGRFVKVAFEDRVLPLFYPLLTRGLPKLEAEIRKNIQDVQKAANVETERMLALYPVTLQRVVNDGIVKSQRETEEQFKDLYEQVFAAENFSRKMIVESNAVMFPLQKNEIMGSIQNVITAVDLLLSQDRVNLLNKAITVWVESCIFERVIINDESNDSIKSKKEEMEVSESKSKTTDVEVDTIKESDNKKGSEEMFGKAIEAKNKDFEGLEYQKEKELDREILILVNNMTSIIFSFDDVLHCYQMKVSVLELYANRKVHENVVKILEHMIDIVVFLADNLDEMMFEAYHSLDSNKHLDIQREINLLEKKITPNLNINVERLMVWLNEAEEDIFLIQEAHAMQGVLIEVEEDSIVGCVIWNLISAIEEMIRLDEKPIQNMVESVVKKMMKVMISTIEKCYIIESKRLNEILFDEFFQSIVREIEIGKELGQINEVFEDMLQAVEREIFVEQALCVLNADFITPFEFAEREKRVWSYYQEESPEKVSQLQLLNHKIECDVQVTVESMILAVICFQEKKYITTNLEENDVERLIESIIRTVHLEDVIFETQKGVELTQLIGVYFELASAVNVTSFYDGYNVLENTLWDVVKPVAIKDLISTCSDMKYYDYGFVSASPFSEEFEDHIKGSLYFYHFHYQDSSEIVNLVVDHIMQAVAIGTVGIKGNVEKHSVGQKILELEKQNSSHFSTYTGTHKLLQVYQELNTAEKVRRKKNYIEAKFQDVKITKDVRSLISIMIHVVEVTNSTKPVCETNTIFANKAEKDEDLIGKLVSIICNTVAGIFDWQAKDYSDVLFSIYFSLSENKIISKASKSKNEKQNSFEMIIENMIQVVEGVIEWNENPGMICILYSEMSENSVIWGNRGTASSDVEPESHLPATCKGDYAFHSKTQDTKAVPENLVPAFFEKQNTNVELLFNAYHDMEYAEEAKELIESIYLVIEELAEIVVTPKPERIFQIYCEEVENEPCSKKVQRNMMCYDIHIPANLLTMYRIMTEEYDVQIAMKYIMAALEEDFFRETRHADPHSESGDLTTIYNSLVESRTVQVLEELISDIIGSIEAVISFSSVDLLLAKYQSLCIERNFVEQLNKVKPVLDFIISTVERGKIVPLVKNVIADTQAILIGVSDTVEFLLAATEKDHLAELKEENAAFFQHFKEVDAFAHDIQVTVKVIILTIERVGKEVEYPQELLAQSAQEKNNLFKMYVEKLRGNDPKFFSGKNPRKMFQNHLETLHDDFHNNLLSLYSDEADKISIRGEEYGFEEVEKVIHDITTTVERNQESDVIETTLEHVLDVVNVYETLVHVVQMVSRADFEQSVQNNSLISSDLSEKMLPFYREKRYFDRIFIPITVIYKAAVLEMKKVNEVLVNADELRSKEIIVASKTVVSNLVQAVMSVCLSENNQNEVAEKELRAQKGQRNKRHFDVTQTNQDLINTLEIKSNDGKSFDDYDASSIMQDKIDQTAIENVISNLLLAIHIADNSPYIFEDEASSTYFWLSNKKQAYMSAYNKANEFERKFMTFTYSVEECAHEQYALMSSYQSFDAIKSLAACLLNVEKAFLEKGIELYNETKSKIDEHHSVNVVLEALIYVVEYDFERVLLIPIHDKVEKLMRNMFHCVTHLDSMQKNSNDEKFLTAYEKVYHSVEENTKEMFENVILSSEAISDDVDDNDQFTSSKEEMIVGSLTSAAVLTVDKIASLESKIEWKYMFNTYRDAQDVEKVIEMIMHASERKELDEFANSSQIMFLEFLKLETEDSQSHENTMKTVKEVIDIMIQAIETDEEIRTESTDVEKECLLYSYINLERADADVIKNIIKNIISSVLWFNKDMLLKVSGILYMSEKANLETFGMLKEAKKKKMSLETIMMINKMCCYKLQEELMLDRYYVAQTVQHMIYVIENMFTEEDKNNYELMACHYSVLTEFVTPEFKKMAVDYIPNIQMWKKLAFVQDIKSVISDILETLDTIVLIKQEKVLKVFSLYQKGCAGRIANEAEIAAESVMGNILNVVARTKTRTNVSKYQSGRRGQTVIKDEKNKKLVSQKGEKKAAVGVENGEDSAEDPEIQARYREEALRKKFEMQTKAKALLVLYQKEVLKSTESKETKNVVKNVMKNVVYVVSSNCDYNEWEGDDRDGLYHAYEKASMEISDPYMAMLLFRMAVNWILEWIVDSESHGVLFSSCARFWLKVWRLFLEDYWIPDETEMYCSHLIQRMVHAVLKGPSPSRLLEEYLLIDPVIEVCKDIVSNVDEEISKAQKEKSYKAFIIYKEVCAFEDELNEHLNATKTVITNMISAVNIDNESKNGESSSKTISAYFKIQKIDHHISEMMVQDLECGALESIQATLNCMLQSVERAGATDGKPMQRETKVGKGIKKSAKIEKLGDSKAKVTTDKQILTFYQEHSATERLILSMIFTIDIIATMRDSTLLFFYKKQKAIHKTVFGVISDAEKSFLQTKLVRKKKVEGLKKEVPKLKTPSYGQDVVQHLLSIIACVENMLLKVESDVEGKKLNVDAEKSDTDTVDTDVDAETLISMKSLTSAVEDLSSVDDKISASAIEDLQAPDEKSGSSESVPVDENIVALFHSLSENIMDETEDICSILVEDMCKAVEKAFLQEQEDQNALCELNELTSDPLIIMTFSINWQIVIRHYNNVVADELIARSRKCVKELIKVMISTVQKVVEGEQNIVNDVASRQNEGTDSTELAEDSVISAEENLLSRYSEAMESKLSKQYAKVFKDRMISTGTKISESPKVVHSVKLYEVPQSLEERKIMQKKLQEIQLKRAELLEKSKQMGMDKVMQYLKQREELTDKKLNLNKRKWKRRKLLVSNKMKQEERFWWLEDKKRKCNKNFLVEQVIDSWNSSRKIDGDARHVQESKEQAKSREKLEQHMLSQISKQQNTNLSSDFDIFLLVSQDNVKQKLPSVEEEGKRDSPKAETESKSGLKPALSDKSVQSVQTNGEESVKDERVIELDAVPIQAEEGEEQIWEEEIPEDKHISEDIVSQSDDASAVEASEVFETAIDKILAYFGQNDVEEVETPVLEGKTLEKIDFLQSRWDDKDMDITFIDFLQTRWDDRDMGNIPRSSVFKYAPDLKDLHQYCYSEHALLQRYYCRRTIGTIVTAAMEAMYKQKPSDPVAYLICFCLKNKHKFPASRN